MSLIRNAPLMDFMSPTIKPGQQFMRHFTMDYFFAQVYRVDRCTTCHVAITKPQLALAEEPFTAHPGSLARLSLQQRQGSRRRSKQPACLGHCRCCGAW